MDFEGLHADQNLWMNKHFTSGRSGEQIQYVVLHYNGGDLSFQGCYDTWQTRRASAHYQVQSDGQVGQFVHDLDTAWHAGYMPANKRSIGIEHANQGDSITDQCIVSGSHLTAAICKAYGLGRPEWGSNVFPHNRFSSTDCPGPLREGTRFHDSYMQYAGEWYDAMENGTEPENQVPASPQPINDTSLGDLTWWGPKFTLALQDQLGSEYHDGIVSRQPYPNKKYLARADEASWQFKHLVRNGSPLIESLQSKIGANSDGFFGHESVKALQQWLVNKGYSIGQSGVDGYMGADTTTAIGNALNDGAFRG